MAAGRRGASSAMPVVGTGRDALALSVGDGAAPNALPVTVTVTHGEGVPSAKTKKRAMLGAPLSIAASGSGIRMPGDSESTASARS